MKIGARFSQFYLPTPFPGTLLREQCREDGGLREGAAWQDYSMRDMTKLVYVNKRIPTETYRQLPQIAYKRFYRNPRTIFALLMKIRSGSEFLDVVNILRKVL